MKINIYEINSSFKEIEGFFNLKESEKTFFNLKTNKIKFIIKIKFINNLYFIEYNIKDKLKYNNNFDGEINLVENEEISEDELIEDQIIINEFLNIEKLVSPVILSNIKII